MKNIILSRLFDFQRICIENVHIILTESKNSWNNINFSQRESDIIKQYLIEKNIGIDYLNKNLASKLSKNGFYVKFASIYIHQKPIVERISENIENKCELGDLVVIFTFLDRTKNPLINKAFIAQAKKEFKINNFCQKKTI